MLLAFVAALTVAGLSLGLSVLFAGAAQASGPSYTVTDLGKLPNDEWISANAINEKGQVVGESGHYDAATNTDYYHAWLRDSANVMQDLGNLGEEASGAYGINESGQVAGGSSISGADWRHDTRPFVWDSDNGMQNLGTPDGYDEAAAYAINDTGQVVGDARAWSYVEGYGYDTTTEKAFLWEGGNKTALGALPNTSTSSAAAINASGQVVGYACDVCGESGEVDYKPFLWQSGNMTALPTLGDSPIASAARDINDQGHVIGDAYYSRNANGDAPAKAWIYKNGTVTALPMPTGYVSGTDRSEASAINNSDQVVGYAEKIDYTDTIGWLYSSGQMYNLNNLVPADSGWTEVLGRDINDKGQIVGVAKDSSDVRHAVLLTPNAPTSVDSASGTVAAGGTVSTGEGTASASDPVNTSITTPVAGSVSIQETSVDQNLQPSGFSFFGEQINISAPQASVQNPLSLQFVVDSSLMPAGTNYANVQLFRDGVRIEPCDGGTSATSASPDPCIKQRTQLADGDVKIMVLSSHASAWNFGVAQAGTPLYSFKGFYAPVDNAPTLNVVKAGSAVPVRFSLGGDKGLSIFAENYPKSGTFASDPNAPLDEIEQTLTASSSGLSYSAQTGQYTYTWKTDKSWAGQNRQLVLRLKDGTEHKALFKFTR